MKKYSKGVIVLIIFIIVIPVGTDCLISFLLPNDEKLNYKISSFLLSSYVKFIPQYIGYLLIAFSVIYLYKRLMKKWSSKKADRCNAAQPNPDWSG